MATQHDLPEGISATVTATSVHLELPTPMPGDYWAVTQADDNNIIVTLFHSELTDDFVVKFTQAGSLDRGDLPAGTLRNPGDAV
jgi:hypothetical protein